MPTVDLTPVVDVAVTLGASALSIFGALALKAVAARAGVALTGDQTAAFDDALDKALTYGVGAADATIRAKGWDSADVKNQVLAVAATYAAQKMPDALKGVGLSSDLTVAANALALQQALSRAYPKAVATAALSPATPPAPPQEIVHVDATPSVPAQEQKAP